MDFSPSATTWGEYRMDACYKHSGSLQFTTNTWKPDNPGWGGENQRGGNLNSSPSIVALGVEKMVAFASGTDNFLYSKPYANGIWDPDWTPLGGGSKVQPNSSISAVAYRGENVAVFYVTDNGLLVTRYTT